MRKCGGIRLRDKMWEKDGSRVFVFVVVILHHWWFNQINKILYSNRTQVNSIVVRIVEPNASANGIQFVIFISFCHTHIGICIHCCNASSLVSHFLAFASKRYINNYEIIVFVYRTYRWFFSTNNSQSR